MKKILYTLLALLLPLVARGDPLESFGPYVAKNEGYRLSPYHDTAGCYTVGIGHRLRPHEAVRVYTPEEVAQLFRADLLVAVHDAHKLFPEFDHLPCQAQLVIVDLAFQLGLPGLFKFHAFRRAVRQHRWHDASNELFYSKYYDDCESRAGRNIRQLDSLAP